MTQSLSSFVGVDVSKDRLDVDHDSVWYVFDFTETLDLLAFEALSDTTTNVPFDTVAMRINQAGEISISGEWDLFATDGTDTTWVENGPFVMTIDISTLDIKEMLGIPEEFALHQNYPNPFPTSTIKFDLP